MNICFVLVKFVRRISKTGSRTRHITRLSVRLPRIFVKFNTRKISAGNIQILPQSDKSKRYFICNINTFVIIVVTSLPYLP